MEEEQNDNRTVPCLWDSVQVGTPFRVNMSGEIDSVAPFDTKSNRMILYREEAIVRAFIDIAKKIDLSVIHAQRRAFRCWVRKEYPECVGQLGSGGYGRVYLMKDTRNNFAAVKEIVEGDVIKETAFLLVLNAVGNDSIVKLLCCIIDTEESDEESTDMLIGLEYVKGDTLEDALAQRTLSVADKKRTAKDLAECLVCLHAHHIHHRDLAARNIAIRASVNKPFLLDFGSALAIIDKDERRDLDRFYLLLKRIFGGCPQEDPMIRTVLCMLEAGTPTLQQLCAALGGRSVIASFSMGQYGTIRVPSPELVPGQWVYGINFLDLHLPFSAYNPYPDPELLKQFIQRYMEEQAKEKGMCL